MALSSLGHHVSVEVFKLEKDVEQLKGQPSKTNDDEIAALKKRLKELEMKERSQVELWRYSRHLHRVCGEQLGRALYRSCLVD